MKRIALLITFVILSNIANAQWVQTNGPYGGYITSLTISGDNIFAGTNGGGIYISSNNGSIWSPVNYGLIDWAVMKLTSNEDYIFAGTSGASWTPVPGGVFRSTNNGSSWTFVFGPPGNPGILSLAIKGTYVFAGNTDALYRSTDNGLNWSQVNTVGFSRAYALIVKGNNIFAGTSSGTYLSTDNGSSWSPVNNGLPTNPFVYTFTISGDNIFAGIIGGGVYLSTDNGSSWSPVNNGLSDTVVLTLASKGDTIIAGTASGIYLSTNNGSNWNLINNGLPVNLYVPEITIKESNIFAGTIGTGVYLSTNNGSNWSPVNNGLNNSSVLTLATKGNTIFAGTDNSLGAFLSTDNGLNWSAINNGLPVNTNVRTLSINENNIFAGTNSGIYLSTNDGTNWNQLSSELTDVNSFAFSEDYILTGRVSGSGSGIYVSSDGGLSWNQTFYYYVYALTTSPNGTGGFNIFAASSQGVLLSTDNGFNWTTILDPLPNYGFYFSAIAINGVDIYAGTGGGGNGGGGGLIFRSTDNGLSWTPVTNGLPMNNTINGFAVYGNNIFALISGFGGVYLSSNNGLNWYAVSDGLPNYSWMNYPSITVSGNNIFVGSTGSGVWRRPLSEMIEPPITTTSTIIITHGYTAESIPNPIKENKARWKHYKWEFGMADQVTTDRQILFIRKGQIYRSYGDYTVLQGIPDQAFIDDVIIQPEYGFSQNLALNQDDEVAIVFDWAEESAIILHGYSEAAADALAAQLIKLATIYPWLLNNIQFIGHSRGAVVNSETIERLLYFASNNILPAGISLDKEIHMTTLDPHPAGHWVKRYCLPCYEIFTMKDDLVNSKEIIGDDGKRIGVSGWKRGIYSTKFIDNYFQENTAAGFIGLNNFPGLNNTGLFSNSNLSDVLIEEYHPHGLVHTYYFGTVDVDAYNESFNEGSYINAAWYSNRDQQGFHFSETRLADLSDILSIDSKLFDISSDKYFTKNSLIFNGDFSKASLYGNIPGWSYQGGYIDCSLGGFDIHGYPINPYLILGDPGFLSLESHSITHNPVYISTQAKFIWFWMNIVTTSDTDLLHVWVGDSEFIFSLSEPYDNWQSVTIPVTKKGTVQTIKFEITSAIQDLNAEVHIDNVGFYVTPSQFDVQVSDNLEVIPIDNITEDEDENIIGGNIPSNKYIIKLKDSSQNSEIKVIDNIDGDYSRYYKFEAFEFSSSDQVILNLEDEVGVPTLNIYSSNSSSIKEIIYPQIISKIGGTTILNNHEGKVEIVNDGSGQNICYLLPNADCIIKSVKVNSIDKGVLSKLLIDDLDKEELIEVVFQKINTNKLINTPVDFSLSQNFPNPFNPTTQIHYAIPEKEFVSLKVFDILGKEVTTLVSEEKETGFYTVDFNGNDLSSGLYVYRIQAGNFIQSKKMILLK